jgi:3-phosphoshikimate 1-carboxyvinyltransferase
MPIKITPPGSKSISNRVLLIRALLNKKIEIKNLAKCDDTNYMIKNLKKLNSKNSKIELYTANAGTTTRFLTALSTLKEKTITIKGDERMRQRPIKELTKALNELGAEIKTTNGCPPLTINPKKIKGGKISMNGEISSQYISAILMIAPFCEEKTTIRVEHNLCSKPYVTMTLDILKQFKINIVNKNFRQYEVSPIRNIKNLKIPKQFTVETDASSASYIGAYAALHPEKNIIIKNISKNSLQGDIKFIEYLKKMGCKIIELKNGIQVIGPKTLKSLQEVDMNETPDLVMTFAILAMFTKGKTKIMNISNLKIKETDRIKALKNEISKLGIRVKATKNSIEINGDPTFYKKITKKITIKTYSDHRIAMSFGILKDLIPTLKIENPSCVSKSYSTFWNDIKKLTEKK